MRKNSQARSKRLSAFQLSKIYTCLQSGIALDGSRLSDWRRKQYEATIKAERAKMGKVVYVSKEYEKQEAGPVVDGKTTPILLVTADNGPARRNPLYGTRYETGDKPYLTGKEMGKVSGIIAEAIAAKGGANFFLDRSLEDVPAAELVEA